MTSERRLKVIKDLEGMLNGYAVYIASVAVRGKWCTEYSERVETARKQIIEYKHRIASRTVSHLTDNGMSLYKIYRFRLRLLFAKQSVFQAVFEDKDPQTANDPPSSLGGEPEPYGEEYVKCGEAVINAVRSIIPIDKPLNERIMVSRGIIGGVLLAVLSVVLFFHK